MLDQCHNIEDKIPGQIRSVLNVEQATAKALLVDRDALAAAQQAGTCWARTASSWTPTTPTSGRCAALREARRLDPTTRWPPTLRVGLSGRRPRSGRRPAGGWGRRPLADAPPAFPDRRP
jgi:L-rhamnose isomerase/sugar isomerase